MIDIIASLVDASWRVYPAAIIMLSGLMLDWRGLRGGASGERGLLRRGVAIEGRIEGFRLVVAGLVLIGLGAAWLWEARWLFFLAIGIGFVEIRESTAILDAIRQGGPSVRRRGAAAV